jgi:hypothetical protein
MKLEINQAFGGDEKERKTSLAKKIKLFLAYKSGGYSDNPIILWLSITSLVANVANWIVLKIFVKPIEGDIILHYNVYFGVDSTGGYREIYFLPVAGIFILVFNFFLGVFFFKNKERIVSYVLLMAALMANLCLIIASATVILINY